MGKDKTVYESTNKKDFKANEIQNRDNSDLQERIDRVRNSNFDFGKKKPQYKTITSMSYNFHPTHIQYIRTCSLVNELSFS